MDKSGKSVRIFADSREAESKIANILRKRCAVEEKQLPVGDYLCSRNVCVERKTTSDFLQSMTDGRLFTQMTQMKENFRNPLLIIEGGTLLNGNRNIHPNAVRGALASIAIDFSVPVLWTENQLETAELIFAVAKREQLGGKRSNAIRGKKKAMSMNETQEYLVSGLPNISREKAKKLLKHFGTPQNIFMASEEELKAVEGVGEKLAKKIRQVIVKKYEKSILED